MSYRYIAIEGNIGAGKTSLASMLAKDMNADLVLEIFFENAFLEKFYNDPEQYAFPVEIGFLKDRYLQLEQYFSRSTGKTVVSDYIFDKCLVFGGINLKHDEFSLYRELHGILAEKLPYPDIILYLHNRTADLRYNILKRGRPYELGIEESYLAKIMDRYQQYFLTIQDIPVLWVDVCGEDFVNDSTKYHKLLELFNADWTKGIQYVSI